MTFKPVMVMNNKNMDAVRVSHYSTVAPTFRIPIKILRKIGLDFNDYVDVLVDTSDNTGTNRIALMAGGIQLKILTCPDTKELAQIRSTSFAPYIEKCKSTIVRHDIIDVNGVKGISIRVPAFAMMDL